MRTLLLMRGCPASSKSTWIKENGLEPYTLSADEMRVASYFILRWRVFN